MDNNSINQKIAEIIEAAEKRKWVYSELQGERSLSMSYPEGETAYFKKKIFELKQQIRDQSLIGKYWIENLCKPDVFESDWMQKYTEILLNPKLKWDENEAFRQLEIFIKQSIQLRNYENIIRENESQKLNNSSKKEYVSLTRSRAFCIMIMYQNGKIPDDIIESKEQLINLSRKEFPKQSGKTVYEALKLNGIYHNFEDQKIKYILDYEYGLKLYKEIFPD